MVWAAPVPASVAPAGESWRVSCCESSRDHLLAADRSPGSETLSVNTVRSVLSSGVDVRSNAPSRGSSWGMNSTSRTRTRRAPVPGGGRNSPVHSLTRDRPTVFGAGLSTYSRCHAGTAAGLVGSDEVDLVLRHARRRTAAFQDHVDPAEARRGLAHSHASHRAGVLHPGGCDGNARPGQPRVAVTATSPPGAASTRARPAGPRRTRASPAAVTRQGPGGRDRVVVRGPWGAAQ